LLFLPPRTEEAMKNLALKAAALGIAALAIPACSNDDEWDWYWSEDDVRVTVDNQGDEKVKVVAETWTWYDDRLERVDVEVESLEALEMRLRGDDVEYLCVRVYRAAGGSKIFDGTWNRGELADDEGRVRITVAP
jgi:hypothetical protein